MLDRLAQAALFNGVGIIRLLNYDYNFGHAKPRLFVPRLILEVWLRFFELRLSPK